MFRYNWSQIKPRVITGNEGILLSFNRKAPQLGKNGNSQIDTQFIYLQQLHTFRWLIISLLCTAVPSKKSSHYMKGVLIGAMSTMALALVVLLAFLWVCLLAKKERAAKRYTEVRKQVHRDASMIFQSTPTYPLFTIYC